MAFDSCYNNPIGEPSSHCVEFTVVENSYYLNICWQIQTLKVSI